MTNQQTGRVDTLIRYQLTNAEEDIKNLEKLAYSYENPRPGQDELSSSEKTKKLQQIAELRVKLTKTMT